jgi:hypothetical protein
LEFDGNDAQERGTGLKTSLTEAAEEALGTRTAWGEKNKLWTSWFNEKIIGLKLGVGGGGV